MKLQTLLMAAAAASLLAACGGGGSSEQAPPQASNEVPASATASPTAYAQYAGSLAQSETQSPLDVNNVTPPTTETGAPITF